MKLLILTSGGDAPGMNYFLAKMYHRYKHNIDACRYGFKGLMQGDIAPLSSFDPLKYEKAAGSCIGCSRAPEFATAKGFKKGLKHALLYDIVIVLGGNGSCKGAKQLQEHGVRVAFIPATIDNDVDETEYAIGFHTAVKACCDSIYNTMPSMQAFGRSCVFEVMGRRHPAIAKVVADAVGATAVIASEDDLQYLQLSKLISQQAKEGISSCLVIRENILPLGEFVATLQTKVKNCEIKGVVVGHPQRGTMPTQAELKNVSIFAKKCIRLIDTTNNSFTIAFQEGEASACEF